MLIVIRNHACPVPLKDVSPQVPVIPRVGKPILVRLHTQDAYDVQRKPQRHAWVFHPSAFAGGLLRTGVAGAIRVVGDPVPRIFPAVAA